MGECSRVKILQVLRVHPDSGLSPFSAAGDSTQPDFRPKGVHQLEHHQHQHQQQQQQHLGLDGEHVRVHRGQHPGKPYELVLMVIL